jgi:opine dehydrogenase
MSVYAVLGAGNGGQALAGILKKNGHEVRLWNRSIDKLHAINENKGIDVCGRLNFHATIDKLTSNISEAIANAKIIFIVVPASAHFDIAKRIAPHVKKNQSIILNPGRTAGCLEVRNVLSANGCSDLPNILETQSLFCACRTIYPGKVNIISFKIDNSISCIPRYKLDELKSELALIYNNKICPCSVLQTSIENIGAILHPAPVILNSGWIESRDVFFPHYYYGISRSIARFLERMDIERMAVADKYGLAVRSVKEWHEYNYGAKGKDLFDTLQKNSDYASIDAPRTLTHRYITEDIPTGLVPISELGRAAGINTPIIDLIIEIGSSLLEIDFRKEGRNLQRLGLEGKTVEEIKKAFD